MGTHRHIDLVCVLATLAALVITVLFMNGEALGITALADGDADDGQFTANDLNADWDRTGATEIALTGDGGSVKGNGAYIYDGDVHIVYAGRYILSGELTGGSVIIDADGDDKIWLLLDGVSLHCDDSAALIVEQAKKVFLTLADGTENVISSGGEYTADAVSSGIDGAIYSRDDLTINGQGSLRVTAEYRHGIVCNDDFVLTGGSVDITAAQDGIHANDSARFADMDLTIHAGDDGITVSNDDATAYVYVQSGAITIPACYEGIEAIEITIAGGTVYIRPTDDGINANSRDGSGAIHITGGDITIINETGRDADGLDSNGSIYITGGNTFISVNGSGGSCAIDYGTENGGVCLVSGGTVIAAGGSAMAEGFDPSSEQCFIMYNTSNTAPGTVVSLTNSEGTVLLSETIPCSFSSVVISTPELQMGETCTISIGGAEDEITVDNTSLSGGFGMGGMGFGRGGRDFDGDRMGFDREEGDFGAGGKDFGRGDGGFAPGGEMAGKMPSTDGQPMPDMAGQPPEQGTFPGFGGRDFGDSTQTEQPTVSGNDVILLGVSALVLLLGLLFAFLFKR